jgi:hypothetical protein
MKRKRQTNDKMKGAYCTGRSKRGGKLRWDTVLEVEIADKYIFPRCEASLQATAKIKPVHCSAVACTVIILSDRTYVRMQRKRSDNRDVFV